jgi:hypothetical protein
MSCSRVPFFWSQHYDLALNQRKYAERQTRPRSREA